MAGVGVRNRTLGNLAEIGFSFALLNLETVLPLSLCFSPPRPLRRCDGRPRGTGHFSSARPLLRRRSLTTDGGELIGEAFDLLFD